jgi:hypothetical protein
MHVNRARKAHLLHEFADEQRMPGRERLRPACQAAKLVSLCDRNAEQIGQLDDLLLGLGLGDLVVLALISWPFFCNAMATLSWLFDTHNSGRIGSPSVAGSMTLRRSSISVASRLDRCRRPPPLAAHPAFRQRHGTHDSGRSCTVSTRARRD